MQLPQPKQADLKINGAGFSASEIGAAFEYATQTAITYGNWFTLEIDGEVYKGIALGELRDTVKAVHGEEEA